MHARRLRRAPRGTSLVEIVVYITIASMILAAVAVYAVGVHTSSRRSVVFTDVKTAANALELYRATTGGSWTAQSMESLLAGLVSTSTGGMKRYAGLASSPITFTRSDGSIVASSRA